MLGLLVTGHGHFATGLNSSLELIAGAQPNVALVDFEADHSVETLKENLAKGTVITISRYAIQSLVKAKA